MYHRFVPRLNRPSFRTGLLAAIIVAILGFQLSTASFTLGAEAAPTPALTSDYWPTDEWRTSSPQEQHMDSQVLAVMVTDAQTQPIPLHSLLVIRHGYIVSETYFPPFTAARKQEIYSVTKSVTSTLAGIAVDQGYIKSLDQPVLSFFPDTTFENVDDRKKAMTLRHLLTMQSGLDWDESKENEVTITKDWVTFILNTPMRAQPGTEFFYCTACSHLVSAIVQQATQMSTLDFAKQNLFVPLGITDTLWKRDSQGIATGGNGLRLRPRDMAKIGYLFLHNGEWDGQRIVSPDWVQSATSTQVEAAVDMASGVQLDYGYMWWIHPRVKGYLALGYDGQIIFILPDLDLEVVMTASVAKLGYDPIFDIIDTYILPAVKDLPEGFLASE